MMPYVQTNRTTGSIGHVRRSPRGVEDRRTNWLQSVIADAGERDGAVLAVPRLMNGRGAGCGLFTLRSVEIKGVAIHRRRE